MIEPRSAREKTVSRGKQDVEIMTKFCRISAEIGADPGEVHLSGHDREACAVVETCPAPVLVAGGARRETTDAALQVATSAMDAGAAGLSSAERLSGEQPAGTWSMRSRRSCTARD